MSRGHTSLPHLDYSHIQHSLLSRQQAAGRHDVFATGSTEGAGDAMGVEIVLKGCDGLRRRGTIGGVGGGMETD